MRTPVPADRVSSRVIRRWAFSWFPLSGMIAFWLFTTGLLLAGPTKINPPGAEAFGALVLTILITALWVLGFHSGVRYTDSHLMITNLLVTTTVAWSDVAQIPATGSLSISLRDGRNLESIQFGGSVLGELTGYPTHRAAKATLAAARARAGAHPTS